MHKTKVLLIVTCFNRKDLTLRFLKSVKKTFNINQFNLDIVLIDDASPDQTGLAVKKEFPEIQVVYGDGTLYWAGGVRLALKYLGETFYSYDQLLLANDDVEFLPEAFSKILDLSNTRNAIVGGTVVTRDGKVESTGGKLGIICKPRPRLLVANGKVQECDMLPGHVLLIPINRLVQLGGFDPNLPYRFLDLDITIRASRSGIPVLLAPEPVAITNDYHDYYEETSAMRGSIKELTSRILLSPKGPYWKESAYYLKKVSPILWWLWLPFYYRAFFKAALMSQMERLMIKKGNNS